MKFILLLKYKLILKNFLYHVTLLRFLMKLSLVERPSFTRGVWCGCPDGRCTKATVTKNCNNVT